MTDEWVEGCGETEMVESLLPFHFVEGVRRNKLMVNEQ